MAISTNERTMGFATRAIHAGAASSGHHGALNVPIYASSTFTFESAAEGSRRFAEGGGYLYHRLGNPTVDAVEQRLAALEGAEAALATGSGMGAISSLFWTVLKAGDEVVADVTLYGCTFALLKQLEQYGITVRFVDMAAPANVATAVSARTRLVYCETPANPTMKIVDITAVAQAAHRHDALFVVDNTFCTPYLQRPLALGADAVVHSATKFLSGHGDILAGVVAGTRELVDRVRYEGLKNMTGATLSPFDAYLLMRGLKTLAVRMDRHCDTAERIARDLDAHPAAVSVNYPGLDAFPQRALAQRQMRRMGGVIAITLADAASAFAFMDALRLARRAVSLGDAETLVQHPASMTHSTYADHEGADPAEHGISDRIVRLSIGLEDYEDIRDDLLAALDAAALCGSTGADAPRPLELA